MTSEAIVLWTETSSDPELIAGVRAGDSAAFGVLYERHVDAARKVAHQYTNSASDVDDVVSESFSRVLRALQRGDGPDLAFRAYLFTIVRRTGMDIINSAIRTKPRDDMSPYESTIGYEASSDEPALDGFEHGMVADAFKSLPERWQAVLWYTEVEKKNPKEIAPLLGLSANGVAALAYRAREALRQAYLQQHLNTSQSLECLEANAQLGAYVRGGLSKREHTKVDSHVHVCERCTALVAELADVNRGMRGIIAPLFMGVLGVGALEGGLPIAGAFGPHGGAAGGAGAGGSGSGAVAAGGAGAAGGTGAAGVAGAGGIAGLLSVASHFALPAAAVVGVTALALNGASILGWFSPDSQSGTAEPPAVVMPADDATDDGSQAEVTGGEGDEGDPAVEPSPSPEPSDMSSDTPDNVVGDRDDAGAGDEFLGPGGGPSGENAATGGGASAVVRLPGTSSGGGDQGTSTPPPPAPGPAPAPAPEPRPDPDETLPTPLVPVVLSIAQSPLDYLEISRTSPTVSMAIDNDGAQAADAVTAQITLPDGLEVAGPTGGGGPMMPVSADRINAYVAFAADGSFTQGDWLCQAIDSATVATCTLEGIAPGESSTLVLDLNIVADDLADNSFTTFTATSGGDTMTYSVRTSLAPANSGSNPLDPGYVSRGGEAVAHFGGTVMGCHAMPQQLTEGDTCLVAMRDETTSSKPGQSNNDWEMVQINEDGGERNSGVTTVALPADATVKAAYLEWSANRYVDPHRQHLVDSWTGPLDTARVRLDSGEFVTVVADTVDDSIVEENREYYLARADVTELLAEVTSVTMTVADIAVASSRLEQAVHTYYGGFTLTVVYEDPEIDPDTTVALFEGPHWVKGSTPVDIRFHGVEGSTLTPSWTAYEGDRGNSGDRVMLGGDNFVPLGIRLDGKPLEREPMDAADSWANGSRWTNTLGIDANGFSSKILSHTGIHTIRTMTDGDNFMIGTFAVTITPPTSTTD